MRSLRSLFTVSMLAFLLAAGVAQAVVWRADLPAGREFDGADAMAAVGRVSKGGHATLIAPRWALTAAHVAQGLGPGDTLRFGEHERAIARVVIHPQGVPDPARPRTPPEVDLALIELAEPIAREAVSPKMPYAGRDEAGRSVTLAGAGDFGPAGATLTPSDGRLRLVDNRVADAGPLRLFLPFDAPPGGVGREGIGAAGDSGGPLFLHGYLAGVSSGADGPPGQYGTVDVYTRVSSHLDWIESVAGRFRDIGVVSSVNPRWPRRALIESIEGWVEVVGTVGVDGKLSGLRVVSSSPAGVFDQAALDAFKRWRFTPRLEAGEPLAREVQQRIVFELDRTAR